MTAWRVSFKIGFREADEAGAGYGHRLFLSLGEESMAPAGKRASRTAPAPGVAAWQAFLRRARVATGAALPSANGVGSSFVCDDRSILVSALQSAVSAYREANPNPSLLGPPPDRSVLDPLAAAIERCASYQAVAGQVLFSGGSGPILQSDSLASHLFSRGGWPTEDADGAGRLVPQDIGDAGSHHAAQGCDLGAHRRPACGPRPSSATHAVREPARFLHEGAPRESRKDPLRRVGLGRADLL